MDAEIVVTHGKSQGERFAVANGETVTVGRGAKADIQLYDDGLSRLHCAIENRGSELVVTDLKSANGTYVNGQSATSVEVYDGDEIMMGLATMRISGPARPDKPAVTTRRPPLTVRRGKPPRPRTELTKSAAPAAEGVVSAGDEALSLLHRAHRDLVTIYRISNAINAHREPMDLADSLVDTVTEVTGACRAAVLLINERDGSIDTYASRERGGDGHEADPEIASAVPQEVFKKGVCVLVSDVEKDARFADLPASRHGGGLAAARVKSLMCVPLLAQSEVIGALYVDSSDGPGVFDEHDLELLAAIGNQAGVALQRVRLLAELENLFFSSMRSLVAAIDAKDAYTHGHAERVTTFALRLARELGTSDHQREVLQLAGLLHDVGKIGVPERVLNKPGELTEEEFEQMKRHPVHGAEIISNIQSPYVPEITAAVRHHHEMYDGSGYPDGLKGDAIPFIARILALADAFDSMTSDRPYRKGFSMDKAIEEVRQCSGTQFDPDIAAALVRLHERGELVLPQTMALKYTTMATPRLEE